MNIAFVLSSFPELSETFILRQITGLIDRGHDVRILAHAPGASRVTHPAVEEYELLDRTRYLTHPRQNGRGRRAPLRSVISAGRAAVALIPLRSPRKTAAALRRVGALVHEPPADVVHCHYGDVGLLWGFAAPLWRAPLIVSFYGYDCSAVPVRYGDAVYHPLFRRLARATALSRHMERRLVDLGCDPDRIVIQPLGADMSVFAPHDRPEPPAGQPLRILSVARLTPKKGLDDALRAVAAVLPQHRIEYDIIGNGPLGAELQRLAAELDIAHVVRFRGPLPQNDVVRAMHDADLFLLPSVVAADGDTEGTPTVLIEAAAAGLPVISTHHAGIPEIVKDGVTGVLVPERSAARLAEALASLLTNADARQRMGAAARMHALQHFDTRVLSARLEDIYHTALAGAT